MDAADGELLPADHDDAGGAGQRSTVAVLDGALTAGAFWIGGRSS
jgi:hypothetical protein